MPSLAVGVGCVSIWVHLPALQQEKGGVGERQWGRIRDGVSPHPGWERLDLSRY